MTRWLAPLLCAALLAGPARADPLETDVDYARAAFATRDLEARRGAVDRLARAGTPAAIDALVRLFEGRDTLGDARTDLRAVAALAPHVSEPEVRAALLRLLARPGTDDARVRDAAALVLAESGERAALSALALSAATTGPVAESARAALLAHPPQDGRVLFSDPRLATPQLAAWLGQLGDQRALPALRAWIRRGEPALQAAAARALWQLGDAEAATVVPRWHGLPSSDDRHATALWLAVAARRPEAAAWVAALLGGTDRLQALDLLLAAPSVGLPARLGDWASDEDAQGWLFAVLARGGTASGVARVARALGDPKLGPLAAHALALAPGRDARRAIEEGLTRGGSARSALRAAVLREHALGETIATRDAIERLLASAEPADRAAAAWAQAARDTSTRAAYLGAADRVLAIAAARAIDDEASALVAARRLAYERDDTLCEALSLSLAWPAARRLVPEAALVRRVTAARAAAPLAALALTERTSQRRESPWLAALLRDDDATVRAHAALGLASAEATWVLGRLATMYELEPDADVRLALVRALAARPRSTTRRVLAWARDLDGDARVRRAARGGPRSSDVAWPGGTGTVWLTVAAPTVARWSMASGLALPFASDPDGTVTVVDLPPGEAQVRLASAPLDSEAP